MMKTIVGLTACILIASGSVSAQERINISEYCVFDGSDISDSIFGFTSDREANEALDRIMQFAGLEPSFVLRAANVPNAVAALDGAQRLILYNQEFMMRVRDTTQTDWSAISILAHEVGHHLQGHTLQRGGSRPEIELEADKYSGFILRRMDATLDDAQAAIRLVTTEVGSPTHPGRQARLAAITNGWVQARDLEANLPNDDPPDPDPVPQIPSIQPVPQPENGQGGFVARAVFPTDPIAYYITAGDDIVAVHPQTNHPVIVGKRIPPTVAGFAWMYSTASGAYGVTPDGHILHRNQFGVFVQVGYITNP